MELLTAIVELPHRTSKLLHLASKLLLVIVKLPHRPQKLLHLCIKVFFINRDGVVYRCCCLIRHNFFAYHCYGFSLTHSKVAYRCYGVASTHTKIATVRTASELLRCPCELSTGVLKLPIAIMNLVSSPVTKVVSLRI